MKQYFSKRNKVLLSELVRTDFKLRYQGSALGYMWTLLRPLFLFGILYLVFGQILRFGADIPNYPVYLLLGIVLWNFFTEATKQGSTAIIARQSLLRKISFPKYIIVVSATVSALINLGINLAVVFFFILLSGAEVNLAAIWIAPLLIIELYIFALAVAFYLSAINAKYRDVQHIWDIAIQAGFYATPIIYPIARVAEQSELAAKLMLTLNPMAQIIQDARNVLVTSHTQTISDFSSNYLLHLVPVAIIVLIAITAARFFRKHSKYFAEDI